MPEAHGRSDIPVPFALAGNVVNTEASGNILIHHTYKTAADGKPAVLSEFILEGKFRFLHLIVGTAL